MLKSIRLSNLQSHENTLLEFSNGFNVLQGKSTSGKTVILRGIRLAAFNKPSGMGYKSWFAGNKDDIFVNLELSDGNVSIKKNEKESFYDVDGSVFTKFGANVPDEVLNRLNLGDINFSEEYDPHYLITSSAGEVAKEINKLTKIEKVDEWMSSLTTDINSGNKDIKRIENEILELSNELLPVDYFEEFNKRITEAETLDVEINELKKKIKFIYTALEDIKIKKEDIFENQLWLQCEKHVEDVKDLIKKRDSIAGLKTILENFIADNEDLKKEKDFLEGVESCFNLASNAFKMYNDAKIRFDGLKSLVGQIRANEGHMKESVEQLDILEKEFTEFKQEVGVCPWCGKSFD